eukprot:scaffold14789_cov95-Skeletonema_marinoi.AAC.1
MRGNVITTARASGSCSVEETLSVVAVWKRSERFALHVLREGVDASAQLCVPWQQQQWLCYHPWGLYYHPWLQHLHYNIELKEIEKEFNLFKGFHEPPTAESERYEQLCRDWEHKRKHKRPDQPSLNACCSAPKQGSNKAYSQEERIEAVGTLYFKYMRKDII